MVPPTIRRPKHLQAAKHSPREDNSSRSAAAADAGTRFPDITSFPSAESSFDEVRDIDAEVTRNRSDSRSIRKASVRKSNPCSRSDSRQAIVRLIAFLYRHNSQAALGLERRTPLLTLKRSQALFPEPSVLFESESVGGRRAIKPIQEVEHPVGGRRCTWWREADVDAPFVGRRTALISNT